MSNTALEPAGFLALRPLADRVLIEQREYKNRLASGLYIPQGSREGYEDIGVVRAIGSKVVDVKVGDTVMFKRKPSSAVVPDVREGDPNGWKNLIMIDEGHILAVIEE